METAACLVAWDGAVCLEAVPYLLAGIGQVCRHRCRLGDTNRGAVQQRASIDVDAALPVLINFWPSICIERSVGVVAITRSRVGLEIGGIMHVSQHMLDRRKIGSRYAGRVLRG